MNADFKDQFVLITGASSGIGRALAVRLARQGAHLGLAARDAERLAQLADECRQHGGLAVPIPTDVADESHCKALVEQTAGQFPRLDMLINNAGAGLGGRFEHLPDLELFHYLVQVNFYGAVYCMYHALPLLKTARGRIVNVTSMGGKLAIPFNTSYVASKAALIGFSNSLRMELRKSGVSVTVVCPYWVVTEFHERFMNSHGEPAGPEGRRFYTPRMMSADRCAEIILKAAARRKREILMGPGKLGMWLSLIAPNLLDSLIIRTVIEPAIRRTYGARDA
jgi:short-subunit dehydrogenase